MKIFKVHSFLLFVLVLSVSSCTDQPSESREVKNLTAFAKLYGYVKYFHPSDEAREINWNKLAVLGAKKVKKANTDTELKKALEALFLPIAPTIRVTETEPDSNAFLSRYLERIGGDTTGLKTVAWQHIGVDMKHKSPIYTSSRINRQDKVWNRHFYLYQNVSAQNLSGTTIRLRAMIKTTTKGRANKGELLLRLNDANGRLIQTVNKTVPLTESNVWQEYTIQEELNFLVSQLTIGTRLKGDGRLWVDNIQLEINTKEGKWTNVSLENGSFEDQSKGRPTGWKSTVTGNYNYRVVSDDAVDGNSFYMASKTVKSPNFLFETYPQVGETAIRSLVTGLWAKVPLALFSDKNHSLPQSSQSDLNNLEQQLELIDLSRPVDHAKNVWLANIIIAWNELQHFYPYFDVIDTNWEAQMNIALEKALTDDTQKEFSATFRHMLATTRDGHVWLRHPSINKSNEAGLPFLVDWIDNKVVITHSLYEKIEPGDIVISVDGKAAAKIVQDQQKQISGSPQLSLFRSLRLLGAGESGTEVTVEIKNEDGVKSYTIQRSSRHSNSKVDNNHLPVTSQIEDGIYYVDLDRAPMSRINDELDQIAASAGVIFDLRGYPNSNHQVIRNLLASRDTSDQWMQIPKIIYPDQKNIVGYQKSGWHLTPAKPHIEGNVVFITDARAISYAESFMSFIEHYNLGEIVGQPTAGTNGNINTMTLPGGYKFAWTGMKVLKHDGSQHHMIGIQPTIPVEKTIQGIREQKDEFLEKAIQVLHKKNR